MQVSVADVPQPINNAAFVSEIEGQHSGFSFDAEDRLFHAHGGRRGGGAWKANRTLLSNAVLAWARNAGHTCQEIYKLRHGKFERIPDAVVWPENSAHVEAIVKAADRHNVVIIPFGGECAAEHPTKQHPMPLILACLFSSPHPPFFHWQVARP